MAPAHTIDEYRAYAAQCLERAQEATTNSAKTYFLEQAAVWHRLATARLQENPFNGEPAADPA